MPRLLDILIALTAFILLSPGLLLLLLLGMFVYGNPIFSQQRIGLNDQLFTFYKFRTWNCGMLSKYGRILKALSLDELPQLYNVLRGDMAMVGPRPLLPEYAERIKVLCPKRSQVRPGMTGLAQINGRNFLSWEEQLRLDAEYVERRNFGLDLIILLRTPFSLLDIRAALQHRRSLLNDE